MASYDDRGFKQTSRPRQYRNQTARDSHDSGVECSMSPAPHGRSVLPPISNIRQSQTPIQPPLSARARSQNGVQRHKEKELTFQLMKEKTKEQAACIEALSKREQIVDEKISNMQLEIETYRGEIYKQAKNHNRFETLATRKLENLETNLSREGLERTKNHERLSTRIGNLELKHEILENKLASNHNQIISLLTQNQKDMGYMKERMKHIPTQPPEDKDRNHDENPKRKKNRNTGSKQEPKKKFDINF